MKVADLIRMLQTVDDDDEFGFNICPCDYCQIKEFIRLLENE